MLVDRVESIVNTGWRVPMMGKIQIDEREMLDTLDLMRTAIPEEIKQARRITQEREKILAQAQTEANRLIAQAQERVERMLAEDNVRLAAEERAQEIVAQARADSRQMREGADQYAMDLLYQLDEEISRVAGQLRNAMNALSTQPPPAEAEEEPV